MDRRAAKGDPRQPPRRSAISASRCPPQGVTQTTLKISFTEGFRRSCRTLDDPDRSGLLQVLLSLEAVLAQPKLQSGMGLRKLHPAELFEIRPGLSLRVFFRISHGTAEFVFLGTHGEVKRFLRGFR